MTMVLLDPEVLNDLMWRRQLVRDSMIWAVYRSRGELRNRGDVVQNWLLNLMIGLLIWLLLFSLLLRVYLSLRL